MFELRKEKQILFYPGVLFAPAPISPTLTLTLFGCLLLKTGNYHGYDVYFCIMCMVVCVRVYMAVLCFVDFMT